MICHEQVESEKEEEVEKEKSIEEPEPELSLDIEVPSIPVPPEEHTAIFQVPDFPVVFDIDELPK